MGWHPGPPPWGASPSCHPPQVAGNQLVLGNQLVSDLDVRMGHRAPSCRMAPSVRGSLLRTGHAVGLGVKGAQVSLGQVLEPSELGSQLC